MDIRRLYIVRLAFSCAAQRVERKVIDDQTEQITLRWPPETRKKINEVRQKYIHKIKKPALNFHGLNVIRDTAREEIFKLSEEADGAMHEIDPELSAQVRLIPLYLEEEKKGEVYSQVLAAIQGRIYTELLGRLKELAKMDEIPKVSRTALIKMCDRLRKWNVVDDEDIEKSLSEIKLAFENDVFAPIMGDLQKTLDDLKERGAFLEFEDGEKVVEGGS